MTQHPFKEWLLSYISQLTRSPYNQLILLVFTLLNTTIIVIEIIRITLTVAIFTGKVMSKADVLATTAGTSPHRTTGFKEGLLAIKSATGGLTL